MADPLSFVSCVASIIAPLGTALSLARQIRVNQQDILSQTYGEAVGFIVSTFFRSTTFEYERLQRVILRGSDDEALRFRDSVTNECNMTAVAGAIVAQVALTALSLTDLSLAHWTARAFLLFATVAGCLSVYYACTLSRGIGKSHQPELIREWLSATPQSGPEDTGSGQEMERKASISAVFILSTPYTMMSYAILAFIVGLAIYQGFVWTRNLDTDAGKLNSRNVFIAYIVSTGFCYSFFSFAGWIKEVEDLLLEDGLRRRPSGGSVMNNRHRHDPHGDGERSYRLDETASAQNIPAVTQNAHLRPHSQHNTDRSSTTGIVAALEAAAKAHTLSAKANRRVASEYAKLFKPRKARLS